MVGCAFVAALVLLAGHIQCLLFDCLMEAVDTM